MEKPALLRAAIEKALPDLKANPEKLTMWVIDGTIRAQKGALGHTEKYRLCINIADLPRDKLVWAHIAIIDWAQTWQPDLLGQGATDEAGFKFEVDLIDNTKADVAIVLKLTEGVFVDIDQATNSITQIIHRKPPQLYPDLTWPGLPENIQNNTGG